MRPSHESLRPTHRPLRIGLVTRQYPPDSIGGIGSYVQTVAALLAEAGHHPVVINAAPGGRRETTWQGDVRVERFPAVGPKRFWSAITWASVRLATRLQSAFSALVAVRQLERFDVIEVPEWKAEGLFLRLARRGPVIVHLHLSNSQVFSANGTRPGLGTRAANTLELLSARLAHGVTASSSISLHHPDGRELLPRRRVQLVAPPLRPGHWDEVRHVGTTAPTVLCIGRLERLKAPETLVAALARLRPTPDLKVVFVGSPYAAASGERYDVYLLRIAAEAGVTCEILPPTTEVGQLCELLGEARVVAVPSRFETLSMVGLEAMAAGRPVVLSSRVGLTELLTDRDSARVAEPGDVASWAAHLDRFLTDPRAAAIAGENNRAAVRELTGARRIVDSRIEAYRTVIDRKTAASASAPARGPARQVEVEP